MLKALGAVLVLAGGTLWGISGRQSLSKRAEKLRLIRWEVGALRGKIAGRGESLLDAFSESGFFLPAADALKRGVPVFEAVRPLGEGIAGFSLFAKGLEAETFEGQLRNIDIFLSELEGEIERANDELQKKGRLCLCGGALAGAAVVIMLV